MDRRRLAVALLIAAALYAAALGAGSALYATGVIGTGATHNDCEGYREEIARERGVDKQDVPQSELKARTQACLDTHEQTERKAFRSEFLFWSIWPAAICALIFLAWPLWARALHRQEEADVARDASRLEPGT